jgi:hypothetical protein
MKIKALATYRHRESIDDLPEPLRSRAWEWYGYFLMRRKADSKPTPQTTQAILQGVAKRLAKTTTAERSAWGRRMLARLGGLRVRESYRERGLIGRLHPAVKAAAKSVQRRRERKQKMQEEFQRQTMGLPPKSRSRWLLDVL